MQVTGDPFRRQLEHRFEMIDTFPEKIIILCTGQLTDMLTDIGFIVADYAETVLHFRATSQDIGGRIVQRDGNGRITASSPQQSYTIVDDAGHRIVNPGDNVTIVQEKIISQSMEPLQGFLVSGADRFVTAIAAGHDQRFGGGRLGK